MLNDQQLDRLDEQLKEARAARDDGYATTINALREALRLVLPDLPRHKGECVNDNLYLEPEQITFARCDYCIARSAIAEKDDELPD
jgi:hypothetical protein